MRKLIPIILLSFLILSSFAAAFNAVSAAKLVENSWNAKTPMTQARVGLGVVAVDGKIYAIGGSTVDIYTGDPSLGGFVGTNERYDPKTDSWVTLASMPTPRVSFAIAAYQGKIYCMGGDTYNADATEGEQYRHSNVVEVYDVATDSWSAKSASSFIGGGIAHMVNGKIFVLVGNALHMYNPTADVWTRKTDATLFLFSPASAVVNNKIVLTGNALVSTNQQIRAVKAIVYDPETDTWSEGKTEDTLTGGGVAVSTTGVYAPQKVYVLGKDQILAYDLTTDTWSTAQAEPSNRHSFRAAVIDDVVYVIGGLDFNFNTVSTNEQYVPIGYNDTISPAPFPSVTPEPYPSTHTPGTPGFLFTPLIFCAVVAVLVVLAIVIVVVAIFLLEKK
jgi:N-acetylneuraminic acid mutarotase